MRNYRTGLLPRVRRRNIESGKLYKYPRSGNTLLRLFLVLCPVRSKLIPASVCWSPLSGHSSPWPKDFSPQTPPVVGRILPVEYLCSFASSILFLRPTSQARTYRAFGHWPSPTGPTVFLSRSPLGSPGFRAKSLRTCTSSLTPRIRLATCDSATNRFAFPFRLQGRQSE